MQAAHGLQIVLQTHALAQTLQRLAVIIFFTMTRSNRPADANRKFSIMNVTLAVVAGQVGCLTLLIVLAAVLGGLWLDQYFQTKPVLTIALLVVSIPISLVVMLGVVRSATRKIKVEQGQKELDQKEEG